MSSKKQGVKRPKGKCHGKNFAQTLGRVIYTEQQLARAWHKAEADVKSKQWKGE